MNTVTFKLKDGVKKFGKLHVDVTLRSATAGDIIDATQEAERLVITPQGPALVASPILTGAQVTRRRVVKLGDMDGPIDMDLLKEFSADDLGLVQMKCDELDTALGREAAQLLEKSGRDEGAGTTG